MVHYLVYIWLDPKLLSWRLFLNLIWINTKDKILKQKSPYRIISDLRSESGTVLKEKSRNFRISKVEFSSAVSYDTGILNKNADITVHTHRHTVYQT